MGGRAVWVQRRGYRLSPDVPHEEPGLRTPCSSGMLLGQHVPVAGLRRALVQPPRPRLAGTCGLRTSAVMDLLPPSREKGGAKSQLREQSWRSPTHRSPPGPSPRGRHGLSWLRTPSTTHPLLPCLCPPPAAQSRQLPAAALRLLPFPPPQLHPSPRAGGPFCKKAILSRANRVRPHCSQDCPAIAGGGRRHGQPVLQPLRPRWAPDPRPATAPGMAWAKERGRGMRVVRGVRERREGLAGRWGHRTDTWIRAGGSSAVRFSGRADSRESAPAFD